MRLFLFLVGGTGSRVLKPLLMQMAAGVRPLDMNMQPLEDVELVPIILDPHKANEDLKRTDDLLRWYRDIRRQLYGEDKSVTRGFFNVKVSTLNDILGANSTVSDSFVFNLGQVSSKEFKDYIDYNTLNPQNQALCNMLFSEDQLRTKMDIGFVGSPNIGSVALNSIKDSEEFRQFANVFAANDRVFIVSSIFGGTGAAGYPILVKNIRDAVSNAALSNRGHLRDAKIGALTVLPYFNIASDEGSPISRNDFINKTKSALYYYRENLTGAGEVNACYYLGDAEASNPYPNDPGGNGQKNMAHIIEFVGALSILDFLSKPDSMLTTVAGRAQTPLYYEYGLDRDTDTITLSDFATVTRHTINRQMAQFHMFTLYLQYAFAGDLGHGYTIDEPQIPSSFMQSQYLRTMGTCFIPAYREWLNEMASNHRSFVPFNLLSRDLANCMTGVKAKSGLFTTAIDYKTILGAMNKESQRAMKENRYTKQQLALKLTDLFERVTERLIPEKYSSIV